jgi:hypothetical protein
MAPRRRLAADAHSPALACVPGRSAGRTLSNPVTINRAAVVAFKSPAPAGERSGPKRRDHRLFAHPCRSIGSLVDGLADQVVKTRYPNVISLGGDHL